MHVELKSIAIAAVVLLAGVDAAAAWERAPAPIEFAPRASRPSQSQTAAPRATAASTVAARVRPAVSIDQPEILYGYGRSASATSRAPIDLRGSLRVAAGSETLPDDAFDDVAPTGVAPIGAAPTGMAPTGAAPVVDEPAQEPEMQTAEQGAGPDAPSTPTARSPAPAVSDAAPPADAFFIQVGAFANPANAERARTALQDVGAVMIEQRQGASATLHRVRLGHWPTRAAAELACDVIVERGFAGAVVSSGR